MSDPLVSTFRCANPDCKEPLLQVHGVSFVRVLACPVCSRSSEFENTSRGYLVRLLPKQERQDRKGLTIEK